PLDVNPDNFLLVERLEVILQAVVIDIDLQLRNILQGVLDGILQPALRILVDINIDIDVPGLTAELADDVTELSLRIALVGIDRDLDLLVDPSELTLQLPAEVGRVREHADRYPSDHCCLGHVQLLASENLAAHAHEERHRV